MNKVYGGTESECEHLCGTCRMGQRIVERSREHVWCQMFSPPRVIAGVVSQCSQYSDRRFTHVRDLEQIAWEIMTNKGGRMIGFRSPHERHYGYPTPPIGKPGF